ncbi:MAG: META domain-containing protein, partial [Anaerolineales bacterium]|nr:META domain-containing protein [Anaerolineales bacterium]
MPIHINNHQTRGPLAIQMILLLLAATLVAGCGSGVLPVSTTEAPPPDGVTSPPPTDSPTEAPPAPVIDLDQITGQLWVLVAYGPVDSPLVVEEGTVITLEIMPDGTISGSSGCNSYNNMAEIGEDGSFTVTSPFALTMMACPRGMEQEQAYLGALESAQTIAVNDEGRLVITYDSGTDEEEALIYVPGATDLIGTIWTLISYGSPDGLAEVIPGTTITAVFGEENITGSSGCNSYTAAYEIQDESITVGPAASTLKLCDGIMEQESAYLLALQEAATISIVGQRLTLTNEDGDGVLIYSASSLPLENTLWRLVAANGQPMPEELEITAFFAPGEQENSGTVAGNSGCNEYFTGYTLDGSQISIAEEVGATLKICETGMEEEQAYLTLLTGAESYRILGRTLELSTPDGTLTYVADRTALQGALWVLTGIGDAEEPQSPVEGANFTAQFRRNPNAPTGVLAGTTGCNEYSTSYASTLNEIRVNPPQVTQNSCGAAATVQENLYFAALNEATSYNIVGNVLRIPFGEDQALVFTGTQIEVAGRLPLEVLDGTRWFLGFINGEGLAPGTEIDAAFSVDPGGESGVMNGSAGCNAYSATFGEDLGVVATLTSGKTCSQPPGVIEQEQLYINSLNRAYGYWLTGDHLIINTGLGTLAYFRNRPDSSLDQTHLLINKTWFLTSFDTTESVAGNAEPTLSFNGDGTFSGNTGCNPVSGNYETMVRNIAFSSINVGSETCPDDAANAQQQAVIAALNSSQTYQVVENTMQILATSGVLNYSTTPPDRVPDVAAPTAVLAGPTEGFVGDLLTYDGSQSTAETPITEYRWNFSDGTIIEGVTAQHAYSEPGTYEVILRVWDELGQVGRTTQNVTITERETPEEIPPTAVIEGNTSGFVAEPVAFSGASSTPGSSPIATYAWDFGNGSGQPPSADPNALTLFDESGTYNVVLTVTDENGLSNQATMSVVIETRLDEPVWVLTPDEPLVPGTAITLQFEPGGTFVGFSGCNTYNGAYTATDNGDGTFAVTISGLTSTQIACPQNVMQQEADYLAA